MAAKWQGDEANAHVDQEFLDAVNAERKKEQLDRATYELFEIIIDRLEKEWFDLVSALSRYHPRPSADTPPRPRTSPSRTWPCPLKTLRVPFATTLKERIRMP